MTYKIGVDGGGTKTECILVDADGRVIASQLAAGCNPSIVGPEAARAIVVAALNELRAQAMPKDAKPAIATTLFCMAGSQAFWQEFAATLREFGRVTVLEDAQAVLELATHGEPGLVLHAGTGSFVAARGPDGSFHYAGGLGWRFGDPGSGYDLGRRAIARALLELQGWASPSRLSPLVQEHTGITEGSVISRFFYSDPASNRKIAALAPGVLRLASEGDLVAREIVASSTGELLDFALTVGEKLFAGKSSETLRMGLSGPILAQPVVSQFLATRSRWPLTPVEGRPIEGVRRLLMRD